MIWWPQQLRDRLLDIIAARISFSLLHFYQVDFGIAVIGFGELVQTHVELDFLDAYVGVTVFLGFLRILFCLFLMNLAVVEF